MHKLRKNYMRSIKMENLPKIIYSLIAKNSNHQLL